MPALFGEQTLRDGEKEKMMDRNVILKTTSMLLAGVLASGILVLRTGAQSAAPAAKSSVTAASTRYRPDRFAGRAGTYYKLIWGVDSLSVKTAETHRNRIMRKLELDSICGLVHYAVRNEIVEA